MYIERERIIDIDISYRIIDIDISLDISLDINLMFAAKDC